MKELRKFSYEVWKWLERVWPISFNKLCDKILERGWWTDQVLLFKYSTLVTLVILPFSGRSCLGKPVEMGRCDYSDFGLTTFNRNEIWQNKLIYETNRFKPFSIFGLTDDSWLNLTDQDLENMLSKYRDLNSRKTGRDTHTNTPNHNVCTSSNF